MKYIRSKKQFLLHFSWFVQGPSFLYCRSRREKSEPPRENERKHESNIPGVRVCLIFCASWFARAKSYDLKQRSVNKLYFALQNFTSNFDGHWCEMRLRLRKEDIASNDMQIPSLWTVFSVCSVRTINSHNINGSISLFLFTYSGDLVIAQVQRHNGTNSF